MELKVDPIERFENLYKTYKDKKGVTKYREKIGQMPVMGEITLVIDFDDLLKFDPELAKNMLEKPEKHIEASSKAVKNVIEIDEKEYVERVEEKGDRFFARFKNLPTTNHISLRKLRAEHIGKFIMVDGILTRSSEVKPQIIEAAFQCQRCGRIIVRAQEWGPITAPPICDSPSCGRKGPFNLMEDMSKFIDWQKIRIQERPEDLPPGQLPRTLDAILRRDLVDVARPGDRIAIVGLLRSNPTRQRGREIETFDIFLDTNYVDVSEKELEKVEITPDEEKVIIDLSKDEWIHQKVVASIAPSVFGNEAIKEAIALQLFAGVPKVLPDGMKIRGEPNVLLVGDPGTAKSQILMYVARLAPRGLYTSGKGTTAAGLTAAVLRDETGGMTLEAGALVLADRGIAAIDEFDKMNPQDRVAIHEAMEQQSYHPSFEITLTDGSKARIGDFVDGLFKQFPDRKTNGIECEIVQTSDLDFGILTTDFDNMFEAKINRVSRHKAPNRFVRILYSNGREIFVTPEHPVFVYENGAVGIRRADRVNKKTFVPAAREIEFEGRPKLDTDVDKGRKEVTLPELLETPIARFLGYFASEGYSYNGSSAEIGLSNTDPDIIHDMNSTMQDTFAITPIDYTDVNRTLRIVSKSLYSYMSKNFPELMKRSTEKRIPRTVLVAGKMEAIEFLNAAFKGDGAIESEAVAYSTSSRELAEDYQDLLLTLGIFSRIHKEAYYVSRKKSKKCRYKVYITGDSLKRFSDTVIPELKENKKLQWLIERSERTNRRHDVLPSHVGKMIITCLKKLGMPYNGYFNQHIDGNYGITIKVVNRYLNTIKNRANKSENNVKNISDFRKLRQMLGYSQARAAALIGTRRGTIDYAERGGYNKETISELVYRLKTVALDEIEAVRKIADKIEAMEKLRWLRVKNVEIVENQGDLKTDWVYDVTVEPTRNFISHGLVLHNTISIAKAGIVATLNARTAILAAANPALGRYNPYRSAAENIKFPVTLLSRFDLIFIITDRPEEEFDKRISDHILDLHRLRSTEPPIEPEILRKYIAYAKRNVRPMISKEAAERLKQFYLEMRSRGEDRDSPVPITARQLEALIRLAEARARIALRKEVTVEDADAVIRLIDVSLRQVGIDKETGRYDIDTIMLGRPKSLRDRMDLVIRLIMELEKEIGDAVPVDRVVESAQEHELEKDFVERAIEQLIDEGVLYRPSPGFVKKV